MSVQSLGSYLLVYLYHWLFSKHSQWLTTRCCRPSSAIISAIQNEKQAIENIVLGLKSASTPEEIASILERVTIVNGSVQVPKSKDDTTKDQEPPQRQERQLLRTPERSRSRSRSPGDADNEVDDADDHTSDVDFDVSQYLSVDDHGQVGVFGLTSTLHNPSRAPPSSVLPIQGVRNQLIANAALERQKEFSIRLLPDIDGVPTSLAMHLLDLHWNRQHHTFLLTYRPAFMRDLVNGGPYCSRFLLNAVFACSSKYSDRLELRDDPSDPRTAGGRFFRRCDELMAEDPPWERSSIPTLAGLLMLGSTFVARGEISKGWSYTGLAIRMAFDLGLHLDLQKPGFTAEDIEIRRRVYWGAFLCDKVQSLYLGRPIAMQLKDCHVPHDFMDTLEELDLWFPYVDPEYPESAQMMCNSTPVHSVSTFQQLCLLSKLMTRIINRFYSVGTTPAKAQACLHSLDEALLKWYKQLPQEITFEPWSDTSAASQRCVPPNVMNLHNTYHSLVILLHRPFISDGHLRSAAGSVPSTSWKKCTIAARNITSIVGAYRSAYSLRGAPYLTSYAVYVSCTIHVRNAALEGQDSENLRLLLTGLKTLDELSLPNPGVSRPANIIRRLMQTNGIMEGPISSPENDATISFDMNTTPKSIPLTSLFDMFVQEQGQSSHAGNTPIGNNIPNALLDDALNDSIYGFMDNSYIPESFNWNG
ncbi:fungal-specific transcription factor domain-containing protein [Xylogone sp. PMI_703]|nr:fungal-specific transcription factor domain-containing protein [Xylogone sp. PMI_703]